MENIFENQKLNIPKFSIQKLRRILWRIQQIFGTKHNDTLIEAMGKLKGQTQFRLIQVNVATTNALNNKTKYTVKRWVYQCQRANKQAKVYLKRMKRIKYNEGCYACAPPVCPGCCAPWFILGAPVPLFQEAVARFLRKKRKQVKKLHRGVLFSGNGLMVHISYS